jgi:hypothetical protein
VTWQNHHVALQEIFLRLSSEYNRRICFYTHACYSHHPCTNKPTSLQLHSNLKTTSFLRSLKSFDSVDDGHVTILLWLYALLWHAWEAEAWN